MDGITCSTRLLTFATGALATCHASVYPPRGALPSTRPAITKSAFEYPYQASREPSTSSPTRMACRIACRRGHATACPRNASTIVVAKVDDARPPSTRVQYRKPSSASPTITLACITIRMPSITASSLNRRSFFNRDCGTTRTPVMMNPRLATTTTAGRSGDRKNAPSSGAAAHDSRNPTPPSATEKPFTWAICLRVRSRSTITDVPTPNSLSRATAPMYTEDIATSP